MRVWVSGTDNVRQDIFLSAYVWALDVLHQLVGASDLGNKPVKNEVCVLSRRMYVTAMTHSVAY